MSAWVRHEGRCVRRGARGFPLLTVGVVASLLVAFAARAQTSAAFRWQASADSGVTWHDDALDVPQGQASVLVRARVSWSPAPEFSAFSGVAFDGVINDAGPSDGVGSIRRMQLGVLSTSAQLGTLRFGSTIKIDDLADMQPPGAGTGWVGCGNGLGVGITFSLDHPVTVFDFVLNLDGTPGTRTVTEVLRPLPGSANPIAIYADWRQLPGPPDILRPPTTSYPIAITVLPAPGAIALLALGGVVAARRRMR